MSNLSDYKCMACNKVEENVKNEGELKVCSSCKRMMRKQWSTSKPAAIVDKTNSFHKQYTT